VGAYVFLTSIATTYVVGTVKFVEPWLNWELYLSIFV